MADPVKFSEANFLFHINRNSGDFVFILIWLLHWVFSCFFLFAGLCIYR